MYEGIRDIRKAVLAGKVSVLFCHIICNVLYKLFFRQLCGYKVQSKYVDTMLVRRVSKHKICSNKNWRFCKFIFSKYSDFPQ